MWYTLNKRYQYVLVKSNTLQIYQDRYLFFLFLGKEKEYCYRGRITQYPECHKAGHASIYDILNITKKVKKLFLSQSLLERLFLLNLISFWQLRNPPYQLARFLAKDWGGSIKSFLSSFFAHMFRLLINLSFILLTSRNTCIKVQSMVELQSKRGLQIASNSMTIINSFLKNKFKAKRYYFCSEFLKNFRIKSKTIFEIQYACIVLLKFPTQVY